MSAMIDWVSMEAQILEHLSHSHAAERRELIALIDEYAGLAVGEAQRVGPIIPEPAERTRALEWLLRPVFICGHHRSGTTLLQNLLDSHPELLSLPSEGTYYTSFAYLALHRPSNRDLGRFAAEWVSRFVDPNFAPHFRLGYSDNRRVPAVDFARHLFGWNEVLRGHVLEDVRPLFALAAAFRSTTAPESVPRRWVEKTPGNERHVKRFQRLGGARFIHVVRDPRAIMASLKRIHVSGSARFDAAAWARSVSESLRLAHVSARRFEGRYLIVHYEDLVAQLESQMKVLHRFLDIAFADELLVPTAGGFPVGANSSFGVGTPGVIQPAQRFIDLSESDVAKIGAYAGKAAWRLGYALPSPGVIRSLGIRFWHWPAKMTQLTRDAIRGARLRLRRRPRGAHRANSP